MAILLHSIGNNLTSRLLFISFFPHLLNFRTVTSFLTYILLPLHAYQL